MTGPSPSHLPLPSFSKPPRLLVVRAPYYREIGDHLLEGCKAILGAAGAAWEYIDVPGALEIPIAIKIADAGLDPYDGYVALGCVIRGETSHYETVVNESARGLMELGLGGCAIGNAILSVENYAQAQARAHPEEQDKGGDGARAALHLIGVKERFWNE